MGLLRTLIWLAVLGCVTLFGFTVKIGKHTLFGHIARIWRAEETQEMVKSVKEESGPAVERVKRGVEAGVEAATHDADAAPADGGPTDAGAKRPPASAPGDRGPGVTGTKQPGKGGGGKAKSKGKGAGKPKKPSAEPAPTP